MGPILVPDSGGPRTSPPRDLRVAPERAAELRAELVRLPSWTLTPRQLGDLEMLAVGGFAPLDGFQGRAAVESTCREMRLPAGELWPIPVLLDLPPSFSERLEVGARLALRDPDGLPLAVLTVGDLWRRDRELEVEAVYGTLDPSHPGVAHELRRSHEVGVGGRLEVLRLPRHAEFAELRRSPAELRAEYARLGWRRVVAFQTRNPMHRAHFELTRRAAAAADAGLLLHPAVGATRTGDVDVGTRIRTYRAVLGRYPAGSALLALAPLAMRLAGPREALLHALVRRNYGCTHLIVGRDHAGPGLDPAGVPFYDPYAAQELVRRHEEEVGVAMVPFREMVYLPEEDRFAPEDELAAEARPASARFALSGSELRRRLDAGEELPAWFTFPEVEAELRRGRPPRRRRGFTVFFTGLSGAGKTTLAQALERRLREIDTRPVTLLDGDEVRRRLSPELGYSRADRDLHVRRLGFVAAQVTRCAGVAICAAIAPYDEVRKQVRREIEEVGGFLEVWVSTPLEVCERRDPKGLYARARAGSLPAFTGVSDPYEPPADAELELDTSALEPGPAVEAIVRLLIEQGYLDPEA